MEVKLVVLGGKSSGKSIVVPPPKFLIGRSEDCHLRPQSDLVSRHHCAVLIEDGMVTVRDLGSRNGTIVNGEKLRGEVELKAGDKLKVGPLEFELQLNVQVGGKKKSKVTSVHEAAARTAGVEKSAATAKHANDDGPDLNEMFGDGTESAAHLNETQSIDMAATQQCIPVPTVSAAGSSDSKAKGAKSKDAKAKSSKPADAKTDDKAGKKSPGAKSAGDKPGSGQPADPKATDPSGVVYEDPKEEVDPQSVGFRRVGLAPGVKPGVDSSREAAAKMLEKLLKKRR